MLPDYGDIKALADREPDWYDDGGVPRYKPFNPRMLGVYDKYAVLAEIACQRCHRPFLVGVGVGEHSWIAGDVHQHSLDQLAGRFHYGDPPRHDCIGDTMNCDDIRIIEAWQHNRDTSWEWERQPQHEGPIPDEVSA